eukprot:m.253698 g.253698  ORF g.253698 m.253698 type:complete len:304 (+) comp19591_c0_seq3:326-1237(+)
MASPTPMLTPTARMLLRNVIYKDSNIIAINKWPGLVTQGQKGGSILLRQKSLQVLGRRGGELPRLVHRLDKPTSGVLIFGRTKAAAMKISNLFADRQVHKDYLAVVAGQPKDSMGIIESWVNPRKPVGSSGRHTADHHVTLLHSAEELAAGRASFLQDAVEHGRGREGLTRMVSSFRVLGRSQTAGLGAAVILMEPITGVTHQLRIQAAYALHTPILGDITHGAFTAAGGVSNWVRQQLMVAHPDVLTGKKKATNRDKLKVPLMLHAYRVTLPGMGEDGTDVVITAPLPSSMTRLCKQLNIDL